MGRGEYVREIYFEDTDGKKWIGWWDGTYWNGAVNVVVEEREAAKMIAAWRRGKTRRQILEDQVNESNLPKVETMLVGGRERRVRDFSGAYSFSGPIGGAPHPLMGE